MPGDSLLYQGALWDRKRLHWQLDVTFKEDACRVRKNYSACNLNPLCKFTLTILRQQSDKLSLKARRWKCNLHPTISRKSLDFDAEALLL